MNTDRLLAIAEIMCGPDARQRVFDPLVADWEREWTDAHALSRTRAVVSGGGAFCTRTRQKSSCWRLVPIGGRRRPPGTNFSSRLR
jgi:hypothetical protein